jgi:hypothetical protein
MYSSREGTAGCFPVLDRCRPYYCDSSAEFVRTQQSPFRHIARWPIAASAGAGLVAIFVRALVGGSLARVLEAATLFLAAAAYLAYALAHHTDRRELFARSILVSAFALWGVVQLAPALPDNAVLNDIVIVLFVVDLAILVSPWR